MSHKAVKVGLTGLVLTTVFGVLLYSTLGESAQYYKYVDEVMAQPDAWYGKPLQVHGYARDIRRKRDSLEYSFEIHREGQVLRATYTGIVPDTFQNESEVVLQGTLAPDGFHATGMTAKCPSKYEPQVGAAAGTTGNGTP
ncbi:MAG: cytochrome c maturation protein CcmE [Acidobacteria bacterium]|nr:cytochrome c maturation protein CcmE [Acidobacteriota bacterium]